MPTHKMGRRLRFAVRSRQARCGRLLDAYGGPPVASTQPGPEGPLAVGPRLRNRVACARWGGLEQLDTRGRWPQNLDCLQAGELSSYNTFYNPQPTRQQNRNPKSKISKKGIGTHREIIRVLCGEAASAHRGQLSFR